MLLLVLGLIGIMEARLIKATILATLACLVSCKKPDAPDPIADESADYTVSTLAGGQDRNYINATGTSARFNYPGGLITDAANNVYVADRLNNRIRKISTSNVVTSFAGTGTSGGIDGNSSNAQFDFPIYLARDAQGNLFVVDSMHLRIRKITPGGDVSTYNPNRTPGYADGPLSSAQFGSIDGLTIDSAGNFFIVDGVNNRIRKISNTGIVSTMAGSGVDGYADGFGAAAQFRLNVNHVAMDQQGNLYVNDNSRIRKITQGGVVSTLITIGNPNSAFNFVTADGLAVDAQGTVYIGVSQSFNGSYLAKINSSGNLVKIAGGDGGYVDGAGSSARFETISFITIDQNGAIVITDGEKIRRVKKN